MRLQHEGDVYLFLVDPRTLTVTWANEKVESFIQRRDGIGAVGRPVEDVVMLAAELGVLERVEQVIRTGEASHLSVATASVEGPRQRADGFIYRLPSGDVLITAQLVLEAASG